MKLIQDFNKELNLIEKHIRLKDTLNEVNVEKRKPDFSMGIKLLLEYKSLIHKRDVEHLEMSEDEHKAIDTIKKLIDDVPIFKKANQIITVDKDKSGGDEYHYKVSNPNLFHFIKNLSPEEDADIEEEIQIIYRNTLYNLCTITEKYFGLIYKDYLMNYHQQVDLKDELLTFDELNKIGDIRESKLFLLDRKLSKIFTQTASKWSDEIMNEIRVNKNDVDYNKKLFNKLYEMYNLRNLFIHGDGVVNDMFLMKTKDFSHLNKGDKINLSINHIKEYKNNIINLMFSLFYTYGCKIYKSDKDLYEDFIASFNNMLLKKVKEDLSCIPNLYLKIEDNKKVDNMMKLMAQINRFINYYYTNQDNLKIEIDKYDSSYLSKDFQLAEAILKEEHDLTYDILKSIISVDEEKIFEIHGWPLIRIATTNSEKVKDLLNQRLSDILEVEDDNMPIKTTVKNPIKVSETEKE